MSEFNKDSLFLFEDLRFDEVPDSLEDTCQLWCERCKVFTKYTDTHDWMYDSDVRV